MKIRRLDETSQALDFSPVNVTKVTDNGELPESVSHNETICAPVPLKIAINTDPLDALVQLDRLNIVAVQIDPSTGRVTVCHA